MRSIFPLLLNWRLRNRIRFIVWDFDGTLYQSQEIGDKLKEAFFQLSHLKNPSLTLKKFDSLSRQYGSWSAAASVLTSTSEFDLLAKVDRLVIKTRYLTPNPPIVNFIESTKLRYKHLILTNSTYQEIVSSLPLVGFNVQSDILGPFEAVFSRDLTHKLKPHPDLFLQILAFTQTPKSSHLFVGDSLSHDIQPALSEGFNAVPIWELPKLFPKLTQSVS